MPKIAGGSSFEFNEVRKCWTARATFTVNGKPSYRHFDILDARNEKEARALAPAVIRALRDPNAPAAPVNGETVKDWAERWIKERVARGLTTAPNDKGYMRNHVEPVLGDLAMVSLKRADIETLVEALDGKVRAKTLSAKTALNVWGTVTKMCSDACSSKQRDLRVRDDDPTTNVAGPDRGTKKSKVYLYPSEFVKFVQCEKVSVEFRQLVAVAIYTYLRASEQAALSVEDVDLAHGALHAHHAIDRYGLGTKELKGKEARRLPIEPALAPLLTILCDDRTTGRVFPDMMRVDKLSVCLRDALTTAGITRAELFADDETRKHITWHDLRATGITWMAVRGDDPLKIQRRAGHKDLSTTQGYLREVESFVDGFGSPFPPLPASVLTRIRPRALQVRENTVRATGFEPVTSSV